MPCLIELGEGSEEVHRKIGQKIGEVCDLAVITTKECLSEIKKEGGQVQFLNSSQDIFNKIKCFSGKDDVILLESRVPKRLLNILKTDKN